MELLYFILIQCIAFVYGRHNVTIDDTDPSITYSGNWVYNSTLYGTHSYGGSQTYSYSSDAMAAWTFGGVAFYFIANREMYPDNIVIAIDGTSVNIHRDNYSYVDYYGPDNPEIRMQSLIWGREGLGDIEHSLVVSMSPCGGNYTAVDALIYTVLDEGDAPTASSVFSLAASGIVSNSNTSLSSISTDLCPVHSKAFTFPIIAMVGIVAGGLIVSGIVLLLTCCYRRDGPRRRLKRPQGLANSSASMRTSGPGTSNASHFRPAFAKSSVLDSYSSRSLSVFSIAPSNQLVPLQSDSPQFVEVQKMLIHGWKHLEKPTPVVQAIFAIIASDELYEPYLHYRATVHATLSRSANTLGNEKYLFHGTRRACLVGEYVNNVVPCFLDECFVCPIIRSSYDLTRSGTTNNFKRFGAGIYTTSCSSKAFDYSHNLNNSAINKVLLLNRVVVGKALKKRLNDRKRTNVPKRYHSIYGEPGHHLNYDETVVYNSAAIRPAYLISFKT